MGFSDDKFVAFMDSIWQFKIEEVQSISQIFYGQTKLPFVKIFCFST